MNRLMMIYQKVKPNLRVIFIIASILMVPGVYLLVYFTGGITYSFSHTMYLVILFAAITLGKEWGLFIAVLAGVMLGPLMPLDTETMAMQQPINYIYRLIIFSLVGFLTGYASDQLKLNTTKIKTAFSINRETDNPNANALIDRFELINQRQKNTLISIFISNSDAILEIMGIGVLHEIMRIVYGVLKKSFGSDVDIVQSSIARFWLIKPTTNVEIDISMIQEALQTPIRMQDTPLYVEYAIGVAIQDSASGPVDFDSFINSDASAREALAKHLPFVVFEEKILKRKANFALLGSFPEALKNNELYCAFQPIIDVKSKTIVSLEALIRWRHPTLGELPPIAFLPFVEESLLIHQMTFFVLNKSLELVKSLRKAKLPMTISVNISGRDVASSVFHRDFETWTAENQICSQCLQFELTESALVPNMEESSSFLSMVKSKGIKVVIDDYGTGYSSLSYLSVYPVDGVKIDRSFIHNMTSSTTSKHIIKSSIDLAHELGYIVTAEGVEEENELQDLENLNCDLAQGFFISKPIPHENVVEWIRHYQKEKS